MECKLYHGLTKYLQFHTTKACSSGEKRKLGRGQKKVINKTERLCMKFHTNNTVYVQTTKMKKKKETVKRHDIVFSYPDFP